jgi:hypothetical protein
MPLGEAVRMWPTPTVNMVTGGANDEAPTVQAGRHGLNLKGAVRMWPTPTVPSGGRTMRAEDILAKGMTPNGKRQVGLWNAVKLWSTPTMRDYRGACHPDRIVNGRRMNVAETEVHTMNLTDRVGGTLNPMWVEWLMGFPIGWTDLDA